MYFCKFFFWYYKTLPKKTPQQGLFLILFSCDQLCDLIPLSQVMWPCCRLYTVHGCLQVPKTEPSSVSLRHSSTVRGNITASTFSSDPGTKWLVWTGSGLWTRGWELVGFSSALQQVLGSIPPSTHLALPNSVTHCCSDPWRKGQAAALRMFMRKNSWTHTHTWTHTHPGHVACF